MPDLCEGFRTGHHVVDVFAEQFEQFRLFRAEFPLFLFVGFGFGERQDTHRVVEMVFADGKFALVVAGIGGFVETFEHGLNAQ